MKNILPNCKAKPTGLPFFIFLSVVMIFYSCNKKEKPSLENIPSGKYLNQTFLDQVTDTIPGLINVYCYEMNFRRTDSVDIYFGFEEATFAYKKSGKGYLLEKAAQGEDMPFTMEEDGSVILSDSTWKNSHSNSRFKKTAEASSKKWDFDVFLNEKLVAGKYKIYVNDKETDKLAIFHPDGSMSGLEDYISYSVCYSGDCVDEVSPVSNNITCTNSKNEQVIYAFKPDQKNKALLLYRIAAPIQDVKGERAIRQLAYDLRR